MDTFDRSTALDHITNHLGEEIQVWFIKRTDDEQRHMTCSASGHISQPQGDPAESGLLTVWDREVDDFRMINLDGVYRIETLFEIYKPEPSTPPPSNLGEADSAMDDLFG